MSDQMEALKTTIQHLEKAQIPYMITGSMAMAFYVTPRMTRDIDIVVELKKEDARKLMDIFEPDFYIDYEMIRDAIQKQGMFNIIYNPKSVKIDFIVRKNEPYQKIEFDRRRRMKVEGYDVWAISPEDLILSKLSWIQEFPSEQQSRDIKSILDGAKIDLHYLESWSKSLGLDKLLREVQP